MVLIFISPMISDVEHFFSAYWPSSLPLWKMSILFFYLFFFFLIFQLHPCTLGIWKEWAGVESELQL